MGENKYKILVVDDDEDIVELIKSTFDRENSFSVITACTGIKTLDIVAKKKPDLVLLDIMLPDMSGYEICKKLRDMGNHTPVIFLSGKKVRPEDKVAGFHEGCDDFILKPFNPSELLCRVKAVLHRTKNNSKQNQDILIDYNDYTLRSNHKVIARLTPKEFRIFALIYEDKPRVVERDRIIIKVWDTPSETTGKTLEVFIANLRRKLPDTIGERIETIPVCLQTFLE